MVVPPFRLHHHRLLPAGKTFKSIVNRLRTSQQAMERKMPSVTIKDRIRNKTKATDMAGCVTEAKRKWSGHIDGMTDNRRTIKSTT